MGNYVLRGSPRLVARNTVYIPSREEIFIVRRVARAHPFERIIVEDTRLRSTTLCTIRVSRYLCVLSIFFLFFPFHLLLRADTEGVCNSVLERGSLTSSMSVHTYSRIFTNTDRKYFFEKQKQRTLIKYYKTHAFIIAGAYVSSNFIYCV